MIAWPALRQVAPSPAFAREADRRFLVLAWFSVAAAIITGGLWLVMVASHMSGMPVTAVVQAGVVKIVLTQTHFGIAWLVRLALLAVMAVCLAVQSHTRSRHVAGWLGLVASFAFVAALAWAGHGAAADEVPYDAFHAPADIVHLIAAGAWLGALLPLAIFLEESVRDAQAHAVGAARAATVRFSVLGLWSVGALIVTGIVNSWFLVGSVPALVGTVYGQLLLAKIALFLLMIAAASVNQRRLVPVLADPAVDERASVDALRQVWRNAAIEAAIGVFVLAIVGAMGILPPAAHTEPNWPLPFRFDLSEVSPGGQTFLEIALIAFALSIVAAIVVVNQKRRRATAIGLGLLVVCGGAAFFALRPGIVEAYPTSFYASTQPYAAPSIARGAPLYAQHCSACHGASGKGDGPLARTLPIPPADLTEPHLFAHKVGEMYWWVGHGKGGVMPGFATKLSPSERWDVINFVLARAAGDLAKTIGSEISTASAVPLPDFAFEQGGDQNTLSQLIKGGPVLVVLWERAPPSNLDELARLQPRLTAAGLHVIAVAVDAHHGRTPLRAQVSSDVRSTLALFRSPADGGETALMLDRNGNIRARWTAAGGLPSPQTLLADTVRVASIPVAAANHAGHAH